MKKDVLKKYAEFGVRERLREIQHEIELLAQDFPDLVRNVDGTLPSVLPLVLKKTHTAATTNNGHGGARQSFASRTDALRGYLATHPGATTPEIATALGLHLSSTGLRRFLKQHATMKRTSTGHGSPIAWTLKKGRAPRTPGANGRSKHAAVQTFLAAHPGATIPEIAKAVGVHSHSSSLSKFLQTHATRAKSGRGFAWTLT